MIEVGPGRVIELILRLARAMRAPRPSPRPLALARSFSPDWRAIACSPTPATNGHSQPSLAPEEPGIDKTSSAPAASLTIKRCALSATVLVGILHGCLSNRQAYSEQIAWSASVEVAA